MDPTRTSLADFVTNRMTESLLCAVQAEFFLFTEAPLASSNPRKQLFLPSAKSVAAIIRPGGRNGGFGVAVS